MYMRVEIVREREKKSEREGLQTYRESVCVCKEEKETEKATETENE